MNKKLLFIILLLIFLFIIPFYLKFSFSKYILSDSFTPVKVEINKKPVIEVIGVSNTNTGYEKYANSTHVIGLRIKVKEKNIAFNNFNSNYIQVFLDNLLISPNIKIYLNSNNNGELIYDIMLSKLTGNGILNIVFPEGLIQDDFGNINDYYKFNTNISIDNISPITNNEEILIEENKSQYIIHSNENLRSVDGWEFYNNNSTLSKNFSSPVYYPIFVTDYAGNSSEVFVDIKNAKNILLYYANYNGYPIKQFDNNGQISGKQAIVDGSNKKSELIATYVTGNVDNSILQAKVFDYTYWGENTSSICMYSEIKYNYGYNPSPNTWYDITGENTVHFLGKLSLQLGGYGHNIANNSCVNYSNPIPQEIANKNLYGLSGIAFKLNNSDNYSIVYQIYISSIGWLKASSDGEETTYAHNTPFSAIRINIVPKSEKQALMNYWNRVIYTNSIN